jgi:plasmid stabilization system protein ParE
VPPYVIYFRPVDDGIQVLRVLHGARWWPAARHDRTLTG